MRSGRVHHERRGSFDQEDGQKLRLYDNILYVSQPLANHCISAVKSLSVCTVGNTAVGSTGGKRTEGYPAEAWSRFDMFHSGSVHV